MELCWNKTFFNKLEHLSLEISAVKFNSGDLECKWAPYAFKNSSKRKKHRQQKKKQFALKAEDQFTMIFTLPNVAARTAIAVSQLGIPFWETEEPPTNQPTNSSSSTTTLHISVHLFGLLFVMI